MTDCIFRDPQAMFSRSSSNPPPALEITMLMLYLISFQRVNGRLKDTAQAALMCSDV
jgi:hypothetical protein